MARIDSNNFAADLLARAATENPVLIKLFALNLGVSELELERVRAREARLDPVVQIALATLVERRVPALARDARRLRAQAQAVLEAQKREECEFGNRAAPSVLRHWHTAT